jgi:hypothetical protein
MCVFLSNENPCTQRCVQWKILARTHTYTAHTLVPIILIVAKLHPSVHIHTQPSAEMNVCVQIHKGTTTTIYPVYNISQINVRADSLRISKCGIFISCRDSQRSYTQFTVLERSRKKEEEIQIFRSFCAGDI